MDVECPVQGVFEPFDDRTIEPLGHKGVMVDKGRVFERSGPCGIGNDVLNLVGGIAQVS